MRQQIFFINPLNAKLNPICHLLALFGAHHILHVSRIRVEQALFILSTEYVTQMKVTKIFDVCWTVHHCDN